MTSPRRQALLFRNWQRKGHPGAATGPLVSPDVATDALDEGPADEQPESHADTAVLQPHELLEDPLALVGRDPDTVVAHRDGHVVTIASYLDGDRRLGR